jgi:lysophospholipase L1-like esterase
MSFLIAEVVMQIYFKSSHEYWLFKGDANFKVGYTAPTDDERSYTLRPNHVDTAMKLTINALSFRGREIDTTRYSSVIAGLGDSVPFGAGVGDDETYSVYLDSILHANGLLGTTVLNAGVPSYNLTQTFYNLKNNVNELYHPKVITVQAANDMSLMSYYREKWSPEINWGTKFTTSWYKDGDTRCAVIYYIKNIFKKAEEENDHMAYDPSKMIIYLKNDLMPRFVSYCAENNITVIFMPIDPFYYSPVIERKNEQLEKWNDPSYIKLVKAWDEIVVAINDVLAETAKNNKNVYYLDTRSILNGHDRKDLYVDFIHYSPKGNRLVANELYKLMAEKNLIKK